MSHNSTYSEGKKSADVQVAKLTIQSGLSVPFRVGWGEEKWERAIKMGGRVL